jgi:hypothetical protein
MALEPAVVDAVVNAVLREGVDADVEIRPPQAALAMFATSVDSPVISPITVPPEYIKLFVPGPGHGRRHTS